MACHKHLNVIFYQRYYNVMLLNRILKDVSIERKQGNIIILKIHSLWSVALDFSENIICFLKNRKRQFIICFLNNLKRKFIENGFLIAHKIYFWCILYAFELFHSWWTSFIELRKTQLDQLIYIEWNEMRILIINKLFPSNDIRYYKDSIVFPVSESIKLLMNAIENVLLSRQVKYLAF